jgi:hypothetical protein
LPTLKELQEFVRSDRQNRRPYEYLQSLGFKNIQLEDKERRGEFKGTAYWTYDKGRYGKVFMSDGSGSTEYGKPRKDTWYFVLPVRGGK